MMPSVLNLRAPRFDADAGDCTELDRLAALNAARARAMERGRQSVRPGHYAGDLVLWLVQDVRHVAPRAEAYDTIAEQVHAC